MGIVYHGGGKRQWGQLLAAAVGASTLSGTSGGREVGDRILYIVTQFL